MITWAYIAGFFDGEGSLHMDRNYSTVQLRIDNTCQEAIRKIKVFLGFGTISNRGRAKPHHKDRYRLTVANHVDVLEMLESMRRYLIVKRKLTEAMITYIKGRRWRAYRKPRLITSHSTASRVSSSSSDGQR